MALVLMASAGAAPSVGNPANGCVRVSRPLLCRGSNFGAATRATCELGRNHVHPGVAAVVEEAYAQLRQSHPQRHWQYGETGRAGGGPFWPHRTHQNGTSVDFFVPMVDAAGAPTTLPIHPFNLFGYGIDLTAQGHRGRDHLDFRALADHLLALEAAGSARGISVGKVILDRRLHPALFEHAADLQRMRPRFNRGQAWVRHDEHYHVDFRLPAGQLSAAGRCSTR